jgi:hypothetical protein
MKVYNSSIGITGRKIRGHNKMNQGQFDPNGEKNAVKRHTALCARTHTRSQ